MSFTPNPLNPAGGVYILNETLVNKSFNGGQESEMFPDAIKNSGLYRTPSWVMGGAYGNAAKYSVYGGTRSMYYTTSTSYNLGTNISVSTNFGDANFQSTMTRVKTNTVQQDFTMRSSAAVSAIIKLWIAYDNSTADKPWPNIYWTCEAQPNQTAGLCQTYDGTN